MNKKHELFKIIFMFITYMLWTNVIISPLVDGIFLKVLVVIIFIPFVWRFFCLYNKYSLSQRAKIVAQISGGTAALLLVPLAGSNPNVIAWVGFFSIVAGGVVMLNFYLWLFREDFSAISYWYTTEIQVDLCKLPKFTRDYLILPWLKKLTVEQ